MLGDQVIELRRAMVSEEGALKELASVAGKTDVLPGYAAAAQHNAREVTYKPNRRGARYKR